MGKEMHHYSHKKGNYSFLSISPFSYADEVSAESPLLISNSGFGYSWDIHPLADCVKSALTFSKALLLRKRKNHSRISRPRTESATLALCVNSAPFNQPEQTGNVATSYARKLFLAREAHCERLSYILKQCAQTLANSLLLGIINLCSSFWRKNTVLTWARGFFSPFLAPSLTFSHGCAGIATVNSVASLRALLLLENNQKFN